MGELETYFENSYLENKYYGTKTKEREVIQPKRLTSLLNNRLCDRSHMSIFEEKELLDFAKNNL